MTASMTHHDIRFVAIELTRIIERNVSLFGVRLNGHLHCCADMQHDIPLASVEHVFRQAIEVKMAEKGWRVTHIRFYHGRVGVNACRPL